MEDESMQRMAEQPYRELRALFDHLVRSLRKHYRR
jgi:hypothetical protein